MSRLLNLYLTCLDYVIFAALLPALCLSGSRAAPNRWPRSPVRSAGLPGPSEPACLGLRRVKNMTFISYAESAIKDDTRYFLGLHRCGN